jgi:hypothetical protein
VLRVELRTARVVGVGVAYYLFLNTPMVAAMRRLADLRAHEGADPRALAKTWPLEPAGGACRLRRPSSAARRAVAHPPFLRGLMARARAASTTR